MTPSTHFHLKPRTGWFAAAREIEHARRVHHAVILDRNLPSYRAEKAMEKQRGYAATEAGQP